MVQQLARSFCTDRQIEILLLLYKDLFTCHTIWGGNYERISFTGYFNKLVVSLALHTSSKCDLSLIYLI